MTLVHVASIVETPRRCLDVDQTFIVKIQSNGTCTKSLVNRVIGHVIGLIVPHVHCENKVRELFEENKVR